MGFRSALPCPKCGEHKVYCVTSFDYKPPKKFLQCMACGHKWEEPE